MQFPIHRETFYTNGPPHAAIAEMMRAAATYIDQITGPDTMVTDIVVDHGSDEGFGTYARVTVYIGTLIDD